MTEPKKKKILITGGAGYIATHTIIVLIKAGYEVVAVDNYSNSSPKIYDKVEEILIKELGDDYKVKIKGDKETQKYKFFDIFEGDICKEEVLYPIFKEYDIEAVIHFAGLKVAGESCEKPFEYYSNNLISTLTLLGVMRKFNVKKLVFSSSAAVYGNPSKLPITEDMPLSPTSPYGRTKLMIEEMLRDVYNADKTWNIVLLRYFNPVGAHPSGLIGEIHRGRPSNLMPYVAQVASGKLECLSVYGNDYDTPDGTGVRDYIHIVDLAEGHVHALKHMNKFGVEAINLGTGRGYSVLEMVTAFEKVSGKTIMYKVCDRRAGDISSSYTSCDKAQKELGWKATRGLDDMCRDLWNFQINYKEE